MTRNFKIQEFKSKDGSSMSQEVEHNIRQLAIQLQVLRDEVNKPITITSGYRSKEHNKAIGGAKKSFHVNGMAADLKSKGMTAKELYNAISELIEIGLITEGGLGLYSSWVHYDIRGYKARW